MTKTCVNCGNRETDACLVCVARQDEKGEFSPSNWVAADEAAAEAAGDSSVNHPAHYNQGKYECIDVMEDVFGEEAVKHFCMLNAFKYIWRANQKNGIEDVKKAIFYMEKMVEMEDGR